MTFGPYGVGHLEGRTVMLPGVAPGDLVEAAIVADRGDYAIGRVDQVLRPGEARRDPPCPFLPRCGGCDWQHLDYGAQVRTKADLIAAAFKHALGINLNPKDLVEPAPREFGYRARIRLKVGRGGAIGYHAAGSNDLVAIDHCMVAATARIPTGLASRIGRRCQEIEVVTDNDREVLVVHLAQAPTSADLTQARRELAGDPRLKGIILRGGNRRAIAGDGNITIEVEPGCAIEAAADLFNQVNRDQNRKLVAAVITMAQPLAASAILDLFCGTGNFSLPLARRGVRVTGVDADPLAITAAAHNAQRMELHEAQFIPGKAADTARFLERARYRPAVVILDPPRAGAASLMEPIARLRPAAVIYVSCDCSTLVRDLHALTDHGYYIDQVRAFDFFPNTHHLEVAVRALLT